MADVKAQELSYDEWNELLEPYGWAEITTRSAAASRGVSLGVVAYELRVMLRAGPDSSTRDEWVLRSDLLDQARRAVKAVQAKGYLLLDAPGIEFGGQYRYSADRGAEPEWHAEARLEFTVGAR
jgi:hypothetical protein